MTSSIANPDLAERALERALTNFLARQFPHSSLPQRRLASLVSLHLQQGHTCLPLTPDNTSAMQSWCGASLSELLDNNPLVSGDGSKPLVRDAERLYLNRYWQLETRIAAHIQRRLGANWFDAQAARAPLAQLFASSSDNPDWQQLACLLAARQGVGIITGGPGTGKTTTVVKLLAFVQLLAQAQQQPPLRILLAAPTGKAAARLNDSIRRAVNELPVTDALRQTLPTEVSTLHRLLGYQRGTRHFRHHAQHRLKAGLVVVDEASMIDIDQFVQLLDALPDDCRLVLVGDKDQLASVDAGAVMSDLCRHADQPRYTAATLAFIEQACDQRLDINIDTHNNIHNNIHNQPSGSALMQQTVTLHKNWRSKDAPGINLLAQAINRQDPQAAQQAFRDYPQQLTRSSRQSDWIKQQLLQGDSGIAALLQQANTQPPADLASLDAWASTLLTRLGQQQLLTPLRQGADGVDGLNAAIIEQLQRGGLIHDKQQFAGKPLLVTRNLYDLELMNGDLGLLLYHPLHHGWRVAFRTDGGMRWLLPEQLEGCSQSAFALSVHKSQGSEFKRVLLYLPDTLSPLLTRELIYTAVTRASAELVLLEGTPGLFEQAILQRTLRHSGLADRLHG